MVVRNQGRPRRAALLLHEAVSADGTKPFAYEQPLVLPQFKHL